MQKLIQRALKLTSEYHIDYEINPKEKKRRNNERDLNEELYEPMAILRVRPRVIEYPSLENYPQFYEQTNLMHLCEKYRPIDS